MELRQIADAIGIGQYSPDLDAVYASLPKTDSPACDLGIIDKLQSDYDTFGGFYGLVRAVATQINADENRSLWIKTACAYAKDRTLEEVNRIPVPKADGTIVTSLLPLYILISMLPSAVEEYRRRGFSEKEIGLVMHRIWDGMRIVERQTGMPGINKTYFTWQTLFARARIFELEEGLQFELAKVPEAVVYIRNKESGQIVPMIDGGMVHRSGLQMLGSIGYEDPAGAFEATFSEDQQNFYGYGCFDCKIDTVKKTYPKTQWEIYLRPGDDFISFHIPEGADISLDSVLPQFEKGRQIAKERYPEHKGQDIFGSSWILDPSLNEIVKPESKIARLMTLFTLYPVKSDGDSIFSFVFERKPDNLKDLPEDSSLRRGLKKMYLEGRYNHIYAGIVTK